MTRFFESSPVEFAYFYSYSFIICFLCMWVTGLLLRRKLPLIPLALLNTLTYVVLTLALEAAGISLAWMITGPVNYTAYVLLMFRGRFSQKGFALIIMNICACVVDGLWAMLAVIFIEPYNAYLLSDIWFYSAFHYLIMPGLSLAVFFSVVKLFNINEFAKVGQSDKKYFLTMGGFSSCYTKLIASLAMAITEAGARSRGVLLLNSGLGLFIGTFSFFYIYSIYDSITSLSRVDREKMLLSQQSELTLIKARKNREYKSELDAVTRGIDSALGGALELIAQGNSAGAAKLILSSAAGLNVLKSAVKTSNRIIDFFLCKAEEAAKAAEIELSYTCHTIGALDIDEVDLCTVISNIVDNAVNACGHVQQGRYISISIHKNGNILFIGCENSKPEKTPPKKRGGLHGYGLINIKEAVAKYNGDVQITNSKAMYKIEVLMYV